MNDADAVEQPLAQGADPSPQDHRGLTPLRLAAEGSTTDAIRVPTT
ncbi:hypothetical protein ACFW3D_16150 [Streptomyces sp. NPDC058864]